MDQEHKTAYAFKNNVLVHIVDVARGLACGCVCVTCKERLIARKGTVRIHHFAHAVDTDCFGAAETVLHLLAKELFKELASIVLPQYNFAKKKVLKRGYIEVKHEQIIVKGGEAAITRSAIEEAEGQFKPDITLECKAKRLFVEIAVTHKVDRKKLRHIRKRDLPAVEIHLDLADALLARDELRNKLQNDLESKHWLFHPRQREAERIFFEKVREAMRNAREPAMHTQKVAQTKPQRYKPIFNEAGAKHYSNAQMDRMRYEFFRKFGRQPTDEEAVDIPTIVNSK